MSLNDNDLEKKIKSIAHSLIYEKGDISSVDVLMRLDYLSKGDYEAWRFGKISYLEKACQVNLSKLSLINKTIRKIANDLDLKKSWTEYNQYGKSKNRRLRFSKSGNKDIEVA